MKPEEALAAMRDVLWPPGDPDRPWTSENIEEVARILDAVGYGHPQVSPAVLRLLPGETPLDAIGSRFRFDRVLLAFTAPHGETPVLDGVWLVRDGEYDPSAANALLRGQYHGRDLLLVAAEPTTPKEDPTRAPRPYR